MTVNDGPLRSRLIAACDEHDGYTMDDLTVMRSDPFRMDTPKHHRDAAWFAEQVGSVIADGRTTHLRGIHYVLVSNGAVKPDGEPYRNTDEDWQWLGGPWAAARWLGYVPFDRFHDARNPDATFEPFYWPNPLVEVADARATVEVLPPLVTVEEFEGTQPFQLAVWGEKTSLRDVLAPICAEFEADLFLQFGDPSDTRIFEMAQRADAQGRPLVAFYFSDCDPSGWNMPIAIARKLQAFQTLHFPELEFQVRRVALTPDQVLEHDLPSTPLKETEQRAVRWVEATGVEQTEIDALAALQPDLLERIAREAIAPFYDSELRQRVERARDEWLEEAQRQLEPQFDPGALARFIEVRQRAEALRGDLARAARELNVDDLELPEVEVPSYDQRLALAYEDGVPIIDSRWSFADQSLWLKRARAYDE